MPTGYTSGVAEGKVTTFEEFALLCARGMGALIMMRDDPLGAEIPEFQPSPFYAEAAAEQRERLAKLEAASDDDIRAAIAEETTKVLQHRTETKQRSDETRKRYENMLGKVFLWNPPTPDHEGLRNFMEQQLRDSIKWDCHEGADIERWHALPTQDVAEYRERKVARCRELIANYDKEYAEEVERTNQRNAWVRQLRESLAQHRWIVDPTPTQGATA